MAPKRAAPKREVEAAPPAKKQQMAQPEIVSIGEVIEQATELPEACRRMLIAGLPLGLGEASLPEGGFRHEMQETFIAMVAEVMNAAQAKLQLAIDEEGASVAATKQRLLELQQAQTQAAETLAEATAEAEAKAAAAAAATTATGEAAAVVEERRAEQLAGDADLVKVQEQRTAVERGSEVDLAAIASGELEVATKHCEALLPVLQDLALDQSLLSALPSVCSKEKAARGNFDNMVLDQLGTTLRERAAALAAEAEAARPAAEARAAAVVAAEASREEARAAEQAAEAAAVEAKAAAIAAAVATSAAKDAVAAFCVDVSRATKAWDAKVAKLDSFKSHNLRSFESLRSKAATTAGA